MKKINSSIHFCAFLLTLFILFNSSTFAQDAAKVDPDHYKVEFENEFVRVLRITYGPGEKSVMHQHPDAVGVTLKDGTTKMIFPDGKTNMNTNKAGQTFWIPATEHLPQNVGDAPFELILIEMKKQN